MRLLLESKVEPREQQRSSALSPLEPGIHTLLYSLQIPTANLVANVVSLLHRNDAVALLQ